ncbi:hypothetical protein UB34_04105 [Photobacterium leiognathi]|uniref:Uncharacterized protein n=1 Tax=Photobacterium leiognathi TaxID=553611 RepID=A0A2T3ME34_PHOLE|nr:hypothetical protein UB42_13015 [Photobacterium leiognathi]KJF99057.1 hypothetical protein UB34_04105 [Photobacterium leiognathi]PSV86292.1 hypothetical protein CTM94_00325 [Photobacterium leiognathi]PSV91915.1 hypothetical protein CTM89_06545 [Photobacterium leiognathi]
MNADKKYDNECKFFFMVIMLGKRSLLNSIKVVMVINNKVIYIHTTQKYQKGITNRLFSFKK